MKQFSLSLYHIFHQIRLINARHVRPVRDGAGTNAIYESYSYYKHIHYEQ